MKVNNSIINVEKAEISIDATLLILAGILMFWMLSPADQENQKNTNSLTPKTRKRN